MERIRKKGKCLLVIRMTMAGDKSISLNTEKLSTVDFRYKSVYGALREEQSRKWIYSRSPFHVVPRASFAGRGSAFREIQSISEFGITYQTRADTKSSARKPDTSYTCPLHWPWLEQGTTFRTLRLSRRLFGTVLTRESVISAGKWTYSEQAYIGSRRLGTPRHGILFSAYNESKLLNIYISTLILTNSPELLKSRFEIQCHYFFPLRNNSILFSSGG